jgi:hypothetical protein
MATNHSHKHDDPIVVDPSLGYEKRDASPRSLLQFGFWMAVVLALTLVAMKWTFDYFSRTLTLGAPASPFAKQENQIPPQPRLQVQPHLELKDYCEAQQQQVDTYGWIDKQSGIVRVPIDRAMDMVLARGLPARASMPAPSGVISDSGGPSAGPLTPRTPTAPDVDGPCGYLAAPPSAPAQEEK